MRQKYDEELSAICQQLLYLHGCLMREQERVQLIVKEKDAVIQQQKLELDRLRTASGTTSITSIGPASISTVGDTSTLDRYKPTTSVTRIHGSFRQYKKEREKSRQLSRTSISGSSAVATSSSESNLSTGWNGSSEESSSSPTTLPRSTQRPPLRLTMSSGSVESGVTKNLSSATFDNGNLKPRKGILKTSSSYGSITSSSEPSENPRENAALLLDNLQKLIQSASGQEQPGAGKIDSSNFSPSIIKNLVMEDANVSKTQLSSSKKLVTEEKSDSGRESDDIEPAESSASSNCSSFSSSR